MVHVIFDTTTPSYDDFVQVGGGALGLEPIGDYYRGLPPFQRGFGLQHGAGIGDVFRGLWRFILPFAKQLGTTVSSEALNTGQRVLEKMNQGESLKNALVSEGKKGLDNVLEKGGLPKQFGTGRKGIKRKGKGVFSTPGHQTIIGQTVIKPFPPKPKKKRIRSDAFGLY